MQQKSVNNAAMESKAYNALKQIEKTSALFNADHIYCNPPQLLENENNKKETINNLKSMLILHLEVVKEQADQLLSKDKLIAKLKQENEELKERLEKYEQRRSQHQAKRMSSTTKNSIKTLPATDEILVVAPTTNNNVNNKKTKGRSQHSGIPTTNLAGIESENKNRCSDNVAATATPVYTNVCLSPTTRQQQALEPPNKRRKLDKRSQNERTPVKGQSNSSPHVDPYEFTTDEPQHQLPQLRQQAVPELTTEIVDANTDEISATSKKGPTFITTDSDYILCDWQKSEAERDAEVEPLLRASLEIPSWTTKERAYPGAYPVEATEDMTDDSFAKRHTKFETDERRRKKWDVQRLREQKQVERLKKRYFKEDFDKKEQKMEHKSITSFYPSADQIKYIQIVDELPVLAFGEPIPSLPEGNFALSWMSSTDKTNMSPTTCFTKTRFFSKKK